MRNKKAVGLAGLAAIMVVGGTLAYFNQKMTIKNPFDTGKYDSVVKEDFTPEDGENWFPGATVNKDVVVKNTGTYDLLVRVKFDEYWENKDKSDWNKTLEGVDDSIDQKDPVDGLITADGSVVKKTFANQDQWYYNTQDKYWYYKKNLEAGSDTGTFLDAVQLIEDADMGEYISTKYYTTAETAPDESNLTDENGDPSNAWVEYTSDEVPEDAKHNMVVTRQNPEKPGYGNADYTLTITVQTVQATKAAMQSAFGLTDAPTDCSWSYKDSTN